MTAWFVYLSFVAAVNPPRLREALPQRNGRADPAALAGGALLVVAAGVVITLVADNLLEALDITPETWRIAAGTVAALVGIRVVVLPTRAPEPELTGWGRALVPVAFPLLLTPELVALLSIYGATESAGLTIGGLVLGIAIGVAAGMLQRKRPGLWLATARFIGAFLILAGFALVVEGIRDV